MENDFEDLVRIFAKTTDEQQMRQLFEEMFTPSEQKDIALRWNLMKDLYRGIPQREIAANHGISLCKITRGSKILKQKNSYCRKILSDRYDDHLRI
ncbi:Trp family transcriptional regulator [Sphaerochaeta sp. PS]|uniref:Trp family transcriptional regulator n=1 Tax=Sphaerochaeta sp. PS TaxID=3076336 RepID=UPI0028A42AD8|nr:Trp family transcriptional regulator [Sphaerochaeta sp. PS]MDT4761983.1 Trp family transcriptional regulator [Sphaerochaeta sp. PS]